MVSCRQADNPPGPDVTKNEVTFSSMHDWITAWNLFLQLLVAVSDKACTHFYNWHTSTTAISKFSGGTQRLLDASLTNSTLVSYSHAYRVYF